ncbi:MAG: ATP-binding protein [Pseudomonadota bacterium]
MTPKTPIHAHKKIRSHFPLFLKLFFIIMVSVLVIGLSIDYVQMKLQIQDSAVIQAPFWPYLAPLFQAHNTQPEMLLTHLQNFPWPSELLLRKNVALDIVALQEIDNEGFLSVQTAGGKNFLYFLVNPDYLLQIGPIHQAPSYQIIWVPFVFYAMTSILVALILWPLVKGLSVIAWKLQRFGAGDVHERIEISSIPWVKDLAKSFNQMTEQVRELMARHKELTYGVSHELRTPLARIKFSLALMQTENTQIEETKRQIARDIEDIENRIDEMLEYAKFESSDITMHPTRVEIVPWLEGVLEQIQRQPHCKVDWDFSMQPANYTSVFDPLLIQRVIENITLNAIKYADTQVTVILDCLENFWSVVVEDDGPGIPEEKRSDVFRAFHQLTQMQSQKGFGLGLAIAERIVNHHQGKIDIKSSRWNGAKFIINFPKND